MDKLVSIVEEKGFWVAYNNELNIGGTGESERQALYAFFDFFIRDYLIYKNTPVDKLSEGAKKLLKKYEEFIKETE